MAKEEQDMGGKKASNQQDVTEPKLSDDELGYSQIRGQANSLIHHHIRPQVGVVA